MEQINIQDAIKDVKSLAKLWKATEAVVALAEHLEAQLQDSKNLDKSIEQKQAKLTDLKTEHETAAVAFAAQRAAEEAHFKQLIVELNEKLEARRQYYVDETTRIDASLEAERAKAARAIADLESERELLHQEIKGLESKREETRVAINKIKAELKEL